MRAIIALWPPALAPFQPPHANSMSVQWQALVRPLHEAKCRSPSRRAASKPAGFSFFLPLLPPPKPDARPQPLFPSYLFVHCDLSQVDVDQLQFLPGLRRIVEFAGKPAVLSAGRGRHDGARVGGDRGRGRAAEAQLQAGRCRRHRQRAAGGAARRVPGPARPRRARPILVHFLGETNRAEVPLDAIRKASEDDECRAGGGARGAADGGSTTIPRSPGLRQQALDIKQQYV